MKLCSIAGENILVMLDDALRKVLYSLMERTENAYFCVFLKVFCWLECKFICLL